MVSLFDRIKILLSIKASIEDETETVISQPAEFQGKELANNEVYYGFLRGEPALQKQTEEVNVQGQELKHTGELERLKHYAELAKQNKLDSRELNEDD